MAGDATNGAVHLSVGALLRPLTASGYSLTFDGVKALAGSLARTDPIRLRDFRTDLWMDPRATEVERARSAVLKRLKASGHGSVVPVDLDGVVLTASCLAALFGSVLERVVAQDFDGRFILGCDPTGVHDWDADAALRKLSERRGSKLVCAWETEEGVKLIGSVDDQVRHTYDFLQLRWQDSGEGATARELAERARSSIQAASNRLARLAELGLAYAAEREPVRGGGAQFRYVPVM